MRDCRRMRWPWKETKRGGCCGLLGAWRPVSVSFEHSTAVATMSGQSYVRCASPTVFHELPDFSIRHFNGGDQSTGHRRSNCCRAGPRDPPYRRIFSIVVRSRTSRTGVFWCCWTSFDAVARAAVLLGRRHCNNQRQQRSSDKQISFHRGFPLVCPIASVFAQEKCVAAPAGCDPLAVGAVQTARCGIQSLYSCFPNRRCGLAENRSQHRRRRPGPRCNFRHLRGLSG